MEFGVFLFILQISYTMLNINTHTQEKECIFQNESYLVRDNGAVLRHSQEGKRLRKLDYQWTFGKLNERTGYLEIASVRIHRIVATAFHGEPPTKKHVVDHIDTNKQNNRPENLRWVTRLENILLNPITVKRIEIVCDCTIDEFLQDIDKYRDVLKSAPTDISWMRRVSADEGKATLNNLLRWAESDDKPVGQPLGEWIYQKYEQAEDEMTSTNRTEDILSIESTSFQIDNWVTKSNFFCIPKEPSIQVYADNLNPGVLFFENAYQKAYVERGAILQNSNRLLVMYKTINKESPDNVRWGIIIITLVDETFIHNVIANYNDMLEHYWQQDTEDHFNCIVNGGLWKPKYNSAKQIIDGDYLESVIREYPKNL